MYLRAKFKVSSTVLRSFREGGNPLPHLKKSPPRLGLKRYIPYKLRKTLAEVLILGKLGYGSVVYQNVPKFLIKRLQRFTLRNSDAYKVPCV